MMNNESFLSNKQAFVVKAENELAILLSQFDTAYIVNIMEDYIRKVKNTFFMDQLPNIPMAFEDNFKYLFTNYPEDKDLIVESRESSYNEIIVMLSYAYDFEYVANTDIDSYTSAKYLYDFFIANLDNYLIDILVKYILDNKETIYNVLKLDQFKKEKDISTLCNKKIFPDLETAIICSHLPSVLNVVSTYSINFDILDFIYKNNMPILSIFEQVGFRQEIFDCVFKPLIVNPRLLSDICSNLALAIQRRVSPDNALFLK